jgi:hypothetical protein
MKILIIVFEFAMYSLELDIKLKIKLFPTYLTLFFFHNVSGNSEFFLYGLTNKNQSCNTYLLPIYPHCFAQSAHQLFACAGIRRINFMKENDLHYSNNSLPAIHLQFQISMYYLPTIGNGRNMNKNGGKYIFVTGNSLIFVLF